MSLAAKRAAVHGALLVLTIWPAVHLGLTARYDLSPWKLAGWGMYSAPRFAMVGMEVYGRRSGASDWEQLTTPSPALQETAAAFLERHRWLRRLAGAGDVVAGVRAEHPEWREIRLVVSYPVIDRASAMVVLEADERMYR